VELKILFRILFIIFVPGGLIILTIKYFNQIKLFIFKSISFFKTIDYKKTFDSLKSAGIIDKTVDLAKLLYNKYKK